MLRSRLLSAAVIISIALVFVALDAWGPTFGCQGFWMIPLGAYLIFGSAIECTQMARHGTLGNITWPTLLGCGGIMLASSIPAYWPLSGSAYPADCLLGKLGWPLAAAVLAQLGCIAWYLPRYQSHSDIFRRAIVSGWVSVYFGCCFAFAVALRMTGQSSWGLYLLVGIILITKFADAGAYFSGRALGRTKLSPSISPGKTVEGLVGGAIVATLAGMIFFKVCAPQVFGVSEVQISWIGIVSLGIALTVAGLLGDLLASIFKREMGCKDSGRFLPGLGGLWDITDSLLPASVVGYLVVMTEVIQGPGQ